MKKRPIRRNIKLYTPDTIGWIGSYFYGPGWYEFSEYLDNVTFDRILPLQLNLNGYNVYYEDGLIPNMEAPKDKSLSVRWWSLDNLREHKLNQLLNNQTEIEEQWFV